MASTKKFHASIVLDGALSGSLKTAFGTTKSALNGIGSAVESLTKRQRALGDSIQTFGRMGRNVDDLRRSYAQTTRQLDTLTTAQRRLNAVEAATVRNRERLHDLVGRLPGGHALGTLASGASVVGGLHAYEKINDAETDRRAT